MAKEVTAYTARVDEQGNINEIEKIRDYIIPSPPGYFSVTREIAGNIIEELGKNGGMTKDEILILKHSQQAIVIPLSVATGTISDMAYNNESFAQAIISNTGATAVGVLAVELLAGGPISAIIIGILASGLANYGYDKLWELSENGKLNDLWDKIFGNKPTSPYAEKVRQNLKEGTRRIDPLVIDLNGDGIKLTDIKESRATFDLSASGFANRVGWVSSDDGFLVWDRNNNGKVDYNNSIQRRVWV